MLKRIEKIVSEIKKDVFYESEITSKLNDEEIQDYFNNKRDIFEELDLDYRMSDNKDFDIVYRLDAEIMKNESNEIDYYVLAEQVE